MYLTLLKAKLHRVTVTETRLDYEGSLSLDERLLEASGILPFEKVEVVNLNTGDRFDTYAIPAPAGSGTVGLNGGAARLGHVGDPLIVLAYALVPEEAASGHRPRVVLVDGRNGVREVRAEPVALSCGGSR